METKIFQDVPELERESMLEANCHEKETLPVQKFFTPEDMEDKRSEFVENSKKIRVATEELKVAQEKFRNAIKKPTEDNIYLMQNLRAGYVEVEEQVYLMADWENRMISYYDRFGEFIKSRKMLPHERQTKIQ